MESEDMLSALGCKREDKRRQPSKAADTALPTLPPMVVMKSVLVKQVRRRGIRSLQMKVSELPCAHVQTPPLNALRDSH
jgi:hypothetical protein